MIQNKSNFIFAAILSLAIFSTVIYFSCQKTGNALACDGVVCHNGGSCLKGQCMCPAGYEDSSCSTTVVTKYLGVWNVLQTIRRSDTASRIGKDTMYQVTFEPTTNNSSFFIYNFLGNSEYNQVLCSISQTNSYSFVIDTQMPLWGLIIFISGLARVQFIWLFIMAVVVIRKQIRLKVDLCTNLSTSMGTGSQIL